MSAQGMLAKLGLRLGTLGSAASLAFAAPLSEGNLNPAAHTDASRIGVYFDRTTSQEKIGFVVMGTERAAVTPVGLSIRGVGYAWPTAAAAGVLQSDGSGNLSWVGFPSAPVSSVFGRTGAVVATNGDYTAAQVTNAVSTAGSYANPSWITGLAWSKISGTPTTLAGYGIGDAQPLNTTLTTLSALANSAGLLRNNGAGVLSWDSTAYLTGNQTITLSGDVSGSGTTAITTTIGANKVTLGMMAQVNTGVFLGRVTAAVGNVEAMTGTQATTLLDAFTSSLKGLAPASGGGTTNFLRADGTWAAPPGGGGTISGSGVAGQVTYWSGTTAITGDASFTFGPTTGLAIAPTAVATGIQRALLIAGAANTNLTASTETSDVFFNFARTVQWATGTIALQRAFRIDAPTYAFVGASTITTASTLEISGPPIAGTNATITNAYAFRVAGGTSRFQGPISITSNSSPLTLSQGSANGTTPTGFLFTGAAHTALIASVNTPDIYFNLARTVQFATGALAAQYAFRIDAPTYAFVGASTLTSAATVYISGAPIAGTNATLTNSYSLLVNTGISRFQGPIQISQTTTPIVATQSASSGGSPTGYQFSSGAHTALTASTETIDVNFNIGRTVQWATGALATQRAVQFGQPTYAFVGASTLTNAATVYIAGAPVAGTNATITNSYALWIGGLVRLDAGLRFVGATSGSAGIKVAAVAGTPADLTLPTTSGTNGYLLQTDGSGNLSWTAPTAAGIGGTIAANQVAYGSGANTIQGTAGFTYSAAGLLSNIGANPNTATTGDVLNLSLVASTAWTKNDSATTALAAMSIKPTFNLGGSNANTTWIGLDIDAVRTATTGLTCRPLSFKYGGFVAGFWDMKNGIRVQNATDAGYATSYWNMRVSIGGEPYIEGFYFGTQYLQINMNSTYGVYVQANTGDLNCNSIYGNVNHVTNFVNRMRLWNDGGVEIGGTYSSSPGNGVLQVENDVVLNTGAGAVYLGPPGTDGSWRMVRSGNNMLMQRRETGSYVTKLTVAA